MSTTELLGFIVLISVVWYWLTSMNAKETASQTGARICQDHDVYFLDESVVLNKLRLRRNSAGHVVFYREYMFEFTSDGAHRYHGKVSMLGKQVIATEMEVYRQ